MSINGSPPSSNSLARYNFFKESIEALIANAHKEAFTLYPQEVRTNPQTLEYLCMILFTILKIVSLAFLSFLFSTKTLKHDLNI